jgi:hypothetical protein
VIDAIVDFWLRDGVQITAPTRILVYGGLFVLVVMTRWSLLSRGDSPLQAHNNCVHTNIHYVHVANRFSRAFRAVCREVPLLWITRVTVVAWVFCIVGFGGFAARLACGVGIFVLATSNYGLQKLNGHRWWVASIALLALAFTDSFATLSVDSWLSANLAGYPVLEPNWSLFHTAFASKVILVAGASTLFAGGVSKIRYGGLRWFRAESFSFYISDPKHNKLPWLVNWMKRNPAAITALAVGGTAIELVSIVPIFVAEVRWLWVPLAIGFHIGIGLFMSPKFWSQCLTYFAVVLGPTVAGDAVRIDLSVSVAVAVATVYAVASLVAIIIRYEGWPVTHIPMYAYDRAGFSHDELTPVQADRIAAQIGRLLKAKRPTIHVPDDLREVDRTIPESLLRTLEHAEPTPHRVKSTGGGGLSSNKWFRLVTQPDGPDVLADLCFYFCSEASYYRRRLVAALARQRLGEADSLLDYLRLSLHLLRKIPGHQAATELRLTVPCRDGGVDTVAQVYLADGVIRGTVAPAWAVPAGTPETVSLATSSPAISSLAIISPATSSLATSSLPTSSPASSSPAPSEEAALAESLTN